VILKFREKDAAVAEPKNLAGLEGHQSVSALGLRWAALRGMLNSPLIMVDEQRPLRDELLRELSTLEQDFSALPSRNAMEISAKVDIAKSALQDTPATGQMWLLDLLNSVQADLHALSPRPATPHAPRAPVNLSRTHPQRAEEHAGSSENSEPAAPSAA
jgi:hypothetical protein